MGKYDALVADLETFCKNFKRYVLNNGDLTEFNQGKIEGLELALHEIRMFIEDEECEQ